LTQIRGFTTYNLNNFLVSSFVDTFRVAIYAAPRKLLTAIPIFVVILRLHLTGGVTLLYTHKRNALKPPLHEVSVATRERGARDGAVGWGTALQTRTLQFRFPMVLLEFFIDIILSVAL
jgi:hypothetical protein